MNTRFAAGLAGVLTMALAAPALAHPGHLEGAGFVQGFLHPLGGIDHLLAMVAVGLWAAQLGGRALWLLPAAFVATLAGGAVLGLSGVALPLVEAGIAASVVILGLLVLLRKRVPVVAATILVAVFALFHGHAHGAEMPEASLPVLYGLGFVAATLLLHGVGMAIMLVGQRARRPSPAAPVA